ncbi:MAG: VTT domain-containing protein [Actinomycetaceae bacterium]|nr:VTT domain-containing protein [Actinomycetaceae bacterium]
MSSFWSFISSIETAIVSFADQPLSLLLCVLTCWGDGFFPVLPSGSVISALSATPAYREPVLLTFLIVCCACAALVGDLTMATIGRLFPAKSRRLPKLNMRLSAVTERQWRILLSTGRFVPIVRIAIFLSAGKMRIPFRHIALLDAPACLIWACIYGLSGTIGARISTSPLISMACGIVLGALFAAILTRIAQYLHSRHAKVTDQS